MKNAVMALAYFLEKARFPMGPLATRLLEEAVRWLGIGAGGIAPLPGARVRAIIRLSRSGRKSDHREAAVNFLELVPIAEGMDFLVLVTTLPAGALVEARGIACIYKRHRAWAAAWLLRSLGTGEGETLRPHARDRLDFTLASP